jgi:hypothetical protein
MRVVVTFLLQETRLLGMTKPPTGNKTSRDDQRDTRDEEIESSKVRKFDGAPADIVDPQTKVLS